MFNLLRAIVCPKRAQVQGGLASKLAPQQEMLLNQKYRSLSMIDQANDSLDAKATGLMRASAIIVALVSAFNLPGFAVPGPTDYHKIGMVLILTAFLVMIVLSVATWSPRRYKTPGPLDWDEMYNKYILLSAEESFAQILSDSVETIEFLRGLNALKAVLVKWSARLFVLQIFCLIIVTVIA